MLIINAKIFTMESQNVENGFIEIKNGKIASLGEMTALKLKDEKNNRFAWKKRIPWLCRCSYTFGHV